MKPPAVADQVQPDQGLAVEEDADAYAIYSALLLMEPLRVTVWNIRNQTERGPLPVCVTPPSDQKEIYRSAIEQFEIRNQEKLSLKRSFDLPAYNLVNGHLSCPRCSELLHFGDPVREKSVPAQDNILPNFEVSAVGFNNERTRALVYVGHHCGNLCGGGTYHLMVKMNGKWEPDREFRGEISCSWRGPFRSVR
jgi:hypothetical protein